MLVLVQAPVSIDVVWGVLSAETADTAVTGLGIAPPDRKLTQLVYDTRVDLASPQSQQARPRAESAPRSLRRALLTPQVNPRVTVWLRPEIVSAACGLRREGKGV